MSLFKIWLKIVQIDPKKLWRRYILAIVVLAAFLGTTHYTSSRAVETSVKDAEVVNLAGRQRMLSQRILFYTTRFEADGQVEDRQKATDAIALFSRSQDTLAVDPKLTREPKLAADLKALYGDQGQLNQRVEEFAQLATDVLDDPNLGIEALLAFDRDSLLRDLDRAVSEFEEIAEAHSAGLRRIQTWSLIAAIAVLIAEGIFIFVPAQLSVSSTLKKLEHQAETLRLSRMKTLERNRELEALKKQIEHDAKHDALTGLPNRRALKEAITALKENTRDTQTRISAMHIDLDRFKAINDTLGHAAGDHVLQHVAKRLTKCARKDDIVARVGGDEFVLLPAANTPRTELATLAEKIIEALREPVPYNDNICHFGASIGIGIGISSSLSDTATPADLLVQADIALYRAKELGRGRYEFFTEELAFEAEEAKRVADELLYAFERNEFIVHYQPLLNARTGHMVGAEALARWQHPDKGLQRASSFIPALQSLGLTYELDHMILRLVERDILAAIKAGIELPRIAINISAQSLMKDEYIDTLVKLEVPPSALSLELSETIYFDEEMDRSIARVQQLREHGFEVEIDDFGTGHASILSLQKLRPARLKIARELLEDVQASEDSQRLVRTISRIGKAYDAEIIAEGVESVELVRTLQSLGCDTLQGYALAQPNDFAALLAYLAADRLKKASSKKAEHTASQTKKQA